MEHHSAKSMAQEGSSVTHRKSEPAQVCPSCLDSELYIARGSMFQNPNIQRRYRLVIVDHDILSRSGYLPGISDPRRSLGWAGLGDGSGLPSAAGGLYNLKRGVAAGEGARGKGEGPDLS